MTVVLEYQQMPFHIGELIYHKEKKVRGNSFSVYADSTIMLQGKVSKNREITIPTDLFYWISITKDNFMISAKYRILSKQLGFSEGQVRIRRNTFGWYLQFSDESQLIIGETVQCLLQLNGNLKPTSIYQKAVKLLEIPLLAIDSFEQLFIGGKGGREFKIFRDENTIVYVKAQGILKSGGSVSLSGRLALYLRDWFEKEQLVIASKNGEEPLILETRVIRKNSSRKPEKCLYFPYYGKSKPIVCVFASPDFQLTQHVLKDLQIKQVLQKNGIPLVKFTSHMIMSNDHYDKQFEDTVKNFTQHFAQSNYWDYFPEVELKFILPKDHILGNKKIVDIILTRNGPPSLLLVEIKTSDKTLGSDLEFAIADLLHTTRKCTSQVRVFPILFINQDIMRLNTNFHITKQYGLSCGIILIGLSDSHYINNRPDFLLNSLTEYSHKQALLIQNRANLIHPLTGEVISQEQLYAEAFEYLSSITSPHSLNVSEYCLLMNLSVIDFKLLSSYITNLSSNNSQGAEIELGVVSEKTPTSPHLSKLHKLHSFLVENDYFGLLELKYQSTQNKNLLVLLQHQQLLQEKLPPSIKISDIKNRRGKGTTYEQIIREKLIQQGYQVASNVFLSHIGKPFEIDHIAFRDDTLVLVSCKDRSDISYEPDLPHLIQEAANVLEFRKNLLHADNAILYVKVNETFRKNQQSLFGGKLWVDGVEIHIE